MNYLKDSLVGSAIFIAIVGFCSITNYLLRLLKPELFGWTNALGDLTHALVYSLLFTAPFFIYSFLISFFNSSYETVQARYLFLGSFIVMLAGYLLLSLLVLHLPILTVLGYLGIFSLIYPAFKGFRILLDMSGVLLLPVFFLILFGIFTLAALAFNKFMAPKLNLVDSMAYVLLYTLILFFISTFTSSITIMPMLKAIDGNEMQSSSAANNGHRQHSSSSAANNGHRQHSSSIGRGQAAIRRQARFIDRGQAEDIFNTYLFSVN